MVFPVVMYRCESWIIKKTEHQGIDASELWCWRRLLRVLWTARRSNKSILKEVNPKYSLEGVMLKLQYFSQLMWRADSLDKTLMLGKMEGRRRRGWQRIRWLDGIINSMDVMWVWANSVRWWRTGKPGVLQSVELQRVRHNLTIEQQQQCMHLEGMEPPWPQPASGQNRDHHCLHAGGKKKNKLSTFQPLWPWSSLWPRFARQGKKWNQLRSAAQALGPATSHPQPRQRLASRAGKAQLLQGSCSSFLGPAPLLIVFDCHWAWKKTWFASGSDSSPFRSSPTSH